MNSNIRSPFLGATRAISFGGSTEHHVHCGVLSKYENLHACYDARVERVNLKDVSDSAGCALIHYLYSGTLEHQEGLETILQIYCVAQKYGIHGMAQHAKEQAERAVAELPTLKVLEVIQRACETSPEDDSWLDELVRVQSRLLLQVSLFQSQDAVQTLFLVKDRVSKTLMQEMIHRCSKTAVGTPTESTVGDECSMTHGYVSVETCGVHEESPVTNDPAPEPSCLQDDEPLSTNCTHLETLDPKKAVQLGIIDLPKPPWKKMDKKKEKREKKAKKRLRVTGCMEEVNHILGGNGAWENCDKCRAKVANLAILYTEN